MTDNDWLVNINPVCMCMSVYTSLNVNIQGVSGGIVNILGGGSMDYSE